MRGLRLGEEPAHQAAPRKHLRVRVVQRVAERREARCREALDACTEGDGVNLAVLGERYRGQDRPLRDAVVAYARLAVRREGGVEPVRCVDDGVNLFLCYGNAAIGAGVIVLGLGELGVGVGFRCAAHRRPGDDVRRDEARGDAICRIEAEQ